jgi:hypothetical protein
LITAEPGEAIGEGNDDWRHALFTDEPVQPFRQALAEADPVRMGQAAAREADKVYKQGQSLSVMSSRDLHVDDAHRRIPQHIALEGLAPDRDPADGTDRPRELAHASHPWLLLISSGEIITQDPLGQLDRGGFWSFLPLGYADKDALALVQTRDPRPVERGDVYEDIVSAAVPNNETEPLGDVVPLHRPHLLDACL